MHNEVGTCAEILPKTLVLVCLVTETVDCGLNEALIG